LLYTIPSLALFVLMPLLLGTGILDPINVVVAMTIYTIALLVRSVVDGLGSVPEEVARSATAMGFTPVRRFFGVDLPLAVPVIAAGLRVAAVSNVSIVSIASLIGVNQLGDLLVDGYNRAISGELVAGILGCVLLALVLDLAIRLLERALTPWRRAGQGGAA
jgi:osmoprotectant transport system permease protein